MEPQTLLNSKYELDNFTEHTLLKNRMKNVFIDAIMDGLDKL